MRRNDPRNDIFDGRLQAWNTSGESSDQPYGTLRVYEDGDSKTIFMRTQEAATNDTPLVNPLDKTWSPMPFHSWELTIGEAENGFHSISYFDESDSFRLKIMKSLSIALAQVRANTTVETIPPWVNLAVLRGAGVFDEGLPEFFQFDDRVLDDNLVLVRERSILPEDLEPSSTQREGGYHVEHDFQLLVQGETTARLEEHNNFRLTDTTYALYDQVADRLRSLIYDENHSKRVFRLGAARNSVLKVYPWSGTVNTDENNRPAFWMRVDLRIVESVNRGD